MLIASLKKLHTLLCQLSQTIVSPLVPLSLAPGASQHDSSYLSNCTNPSPCLLKIDEDVDARVFQSFE